MNIEDPINTNTIIVHDLNTSLSQMDQLNKQQYKANIRAESHIPTNRLHSYLQSVYPGTTQ